MYVYSISFPFRQLSAQGFLNPTYFRHKKRGCERHSRSHQGKMLTSSMVWTNKIEVPHCSYTIFERNLRMHSLVDAIHGSFGVHTHPCPTRYISGLLHLRPAVSTCCICLWTKHKWSIFVLLSSDSKDLESEAVQ